MDHIGRDITEILRPVGGEANERLVEPPLAAFDRTWLTDYRFRMLAGWLVLFCLTDVAIMLFWITILLLKATV